MIEVRIRMPHSAGISEHLGRMVIETLAVPGGSLSVREVDDRPSPPPGEMVVSAGPVEVVGS